MDIQGLLSGAFFGMLIGQVVNYLINKGAVAKAVEEAEKIIPERYEKMIVKVLDEASREFKEDEDDKE